MSDNQNTQQTKPHLNDRVGAYGYDYGQVGIISEHLHLVDIEIKVPRHGRPLAVAPDGTTAKILCSEVISVPTEDGPVSGRCGERVETKDGYACPGHTEVIEGWHLQTELEGAYWEYQQEREGAFR